MSGTQSEIITLGGFDAALLGQITLSVVSSQYLAGGIAIGSTSTTVGLLTLGGVDGKGDNWGYAASPVVDGDNLIICASGPNALVVALDKNTGKDVWKGGGDEQAGSATPVNQTRMWED